MRFLSRKMTWSDLTDLTIQFSGNGLLEGMRGSSEEAIIITQVRDNGGLEQVVRNGQIPEVLE